MKTTVSWLHSYVALPALSLEELCERLTMAGHEVESVSADADPVLELEVTPNRPDCLSVVGLARELAAVTGAPFSVPAIPAKGTPSVRTGRRIYVEIEDRTLCPRYSARIMTGVTVCPSAGQVAAALQAIGVRRVNNIVDATNFVLYELGQPLHAFDLDKIAGDTVTVRPARAQERIVTIDGKERTLDAGMLVIADREGPIALAGIMGGVRTEVTSATKNILLESAVFDPISIRRTARKLALHSDSSYRFERTVDLERVVIASDRVRALIGECARGCAEALIDVGTKKITRPLLSLRPANVARLLGVEVPARDVKRILASLGLSVTVKKNGVFSCRPPSFRPDLRQEADLIEEIARVRGYASVPDRLPLPLGAAEVYPLQIIARDRTVEALTGLGLSQIATYSLLSAAHVRRFCSCEEQIVRLTNPMSAEQEMMRTSLLPGMVQTLAWNVNRRNQDLALFELGTVYLRADARYREELRLCIGLTGRHNAHWQRERLYDFFDLKGILEALCAHLRVRLDIAPAPEAGSLDPAMAAAVLHEGKQIGVIGKLSSALGREYHMDADIYIGEIDIRPVIAGSSSQTRYRTLPKYPPVRRDLSILVDERVTVCQIEEAIRSAARPYAHHIVLFDQYTGAQVPAGKRSLSFAVEYLAPERTLTDEETGALQQRVIDALCAQYGAALRG